MICLQTYTTYVISVFFDTARVCLQTFRIFDTCNFCLQTFIALVNSDLSIVFNTTQVLFNWNRFSQLRNFSDASFFFWQRKFSFRGSGHFQTCSKYPSYYVIITWFRYQFILNVLYFDVILWKKNWRRVIKLTFHSGNHLNNVNISLDLSAFIQRLIYNYSYWEPFNRSHVTCILSNIWKDFLSNFLSYQHW